MILLRAFVDGVQLALAVLLGGCSLTVAAAGDLQLSAERTRDPLGALPLHGDLRVVNLEGPLTDAPSRGVRGRPAQAAWLRGRVDVATTANNHADDAGERGRADTERALGRAHVIAVARDRSFSIRGHRVTLLARSYAPGVERDDELVRAVAQHPGLVIVSLHWGHTGSLLPTEGQRAFAAQLVDAGARLVLGHGPHTPQGLERRRDAVIAYSLGNLSFDCDCTTERDAYTLEVRFDRRDRLEGLRITPLRAGLHDDPQRSHDAELASLIQQLSAELGTKLEREDDLLSQ